MIDSVAIECKRIIIPAELQSQALEQIQSNYMSIQKQGYKLGKPYTPHVLDISRHSERKNIPCEIPRKPRKIIGADLFTFNTSNFHCVVDYHSRYPAIKEAEKSHAVNLY